MGVFQVIKDLDDVALKELLEAIAELRAIGRMTAREFYNILDDDYKTRNNLKWDEAALAQIAQFKTLAWRIAILSVHAGLEEETSEPDHP